jgi:phage terminase large subunit-like protein
MGLDYARKVTSGEIPAGQWVKLACQRQLDDLKRAQQPDPQPLGEAVPQKILKFKPKEQ